MTRTSRKMSTLKTISAALKLVDTKKQNLKKAYDDLQSHSSLLSSFPLSWSHLDSHFSTLHNSLSERFLHLQSLESQNNPSNDDPSPSSSKFPDPDTKDRNFSSFPNDPPSSSTTQNGTTVATLPVNHAEALNALCKSMDGKGLRDYIGEHFKDRFALKTELQSALNCATDPAALVIDSTDGVVGANVAKDDLRRMKRSCGVLFQQLRAVSPHVNGKVRKRINSLYSEWKGSLLHDNTDSVGALAFLHFLAAFGMLSELNINELATFSTMASANDQISELTQIVGLTDKVPGLVQKLIDRGKHVLAVKYIFEFNLVDKIPPVPILKAHVNESEKLGRRLAHEGKSVKEITAREINALRSVIKVIENHNLESEFPPASIEQRIEELRKNKTIVKHPAPAFAAKPPQHQQQQSGIKRPRTSAPVGPAAVFNNANSASSNISQYQQPHFQSTGLLLELSNPYMNLPPMPYGVMAPTPSPTVPSYTGPSTGLYGMDGVPMGHSGNLGEGGSHPNSSETLVPSGYYDTVPANEGYGLQHYYQTSYPQ